MEFNDGYPQYEMMAHHSEEEGKGVRKKLWRVFWIMLAITVVELVIGISQDRLHLTGTVMLKFIYIIFTVVKAGFIVYSFMHLGDENHFLRKVILWPYVIFALYLTYLCTVTEGNFVRDHKMYEDKVLIEQRIKQRQEAIDRANGKIADGQHKSGEGH
ncbi:MAG: cytochrome C oxidase subunit IV family protein [Bacteroidia bacterium]|nr:cytochrome C oxidase subunit IV family protein [Bacteroidia bacterium]